ncbi:MAG: HD domain-containing protein [Melioribacteraceae bacterium]|nr:HD domain-containing protein [Melioribacteraceae bacterium]
MLEYFESIKFLEKASETAGDLNVGIFIVGGFVRDLVLNRETNEIDFLVVGDGVMFASIFADRLGVKKINIYKNFGTAQFSFNNYNLEFVGARKESYNPESRNPDIAPGTFKDDIHRRDFTINSLAISLNQSNYGELIDTFGGLNDIYDRIIKTPLDPLLTFDDDPLRILRAFRFAAQLVFNVHQSVLDAAAKLRDRLTIISQERITDEFMKILASPKPSIGMLLLEETGVMEIIFPEISAMTGVEQRKEHHHKDVFLHTLQVVDNVAAVSDNLWLRFAALVHDIAKPPTKKFVEGTGWTFHGHDELGARMMKSIFRRMKLPFHKLEYVQKMIRLHLRPIALVDDIVTDSAIRRLIVSADNDLDDLIVLCRADITSKNPEKVSRYLSNYEKVMERVKEVKEKDALRAFQSPVRGDVIMEVCGLAPCKTVGLIKSEIEEAIIDGKIKNTYEDAFEYLLKIKEKFIASNNSHSTV